MSVLSLALRGSPIIQHGGRLIVFPARKALALLAYLALERGAHSHEKLSALLWPERDASQARTTLRSTLELLRTALGEPAAHLTATRWLSTGCPNIRLIRMCCALLPARLP